MKHLLLILFMAISQLAFSQKEQESIAQNVVDAYNKRDLNAFLKPYADDVEVYYYPNTLVYKGKDKLKNTFESIFMQFLDLNYKLKNRIVKGNIVIDEANVIFDKEIAAVSSIAIYTIENNKIKRVTFIK